ncbi:Na+/melibiose symporter-like transporter [Rhodobacteraceae bacterium HIMB11]|nr:Na+/melibiose symporter-like transporter [Rhodobacteraceae bacterium HIMB11]
MSKTVPNRRILIAVGLFGVMLGAVGLPIYLHAPKYFSDTYGVSLASLGAIMFALRVVDFVQDPLLGRLSAIGFLSNRLLSAGAGAMIIAGAVGLFVVTAPIDPTIWFALSLMLLFTGYSLSVILLYTHATNNFADTAQPIFARWREAGQLIGICLSAIAPTLFTEISHVPYTLFGGFLISITGVAVVLMHNSWSEQMTTTSQKFSFVAPDTRIRPYLILAFVNAIPVAITSTLFLFYVEYAIGSATASGPLLLLFFGAAAVSVPIWTILANKYAIEWVLGVAMLASLIAFVVTFTLGAGDIVAFAIICGVTGVLTGADLTLLPMIFIKFLQRTNVPSEEAFGYWSLSSKLALALAVGLVLPGLEVSGFDPAFPTPLGIYNLSVAYALVPSVLKICAIYALWRVTKPQSASVQGLSR